MNKTVFILYPCCQVYLTTRDLPIIKTTYVILITPLRLTQLQRNCVGFGGAASGALTFTCASAQVATKLCSFIL